MKDSEKRTKEFKVGDVVAYCERFINRIGQEFTNVKAARGKVMALITVHEELVMAEIEWDTPYLPKRVDVRNLTTPSGIAIGE